MNLNTILKETIAKGAQRATRKPIAALRSDVAELKRQVAGLRRSLRALQKDDRGGVCEDSDESAATPAAQPGMRPTGAMVLKLRKRLGLTQTQMARLAEVSSLTVSKWEGTAGRIKMRGRTLGALAKIRAMGKRAAHAALTNA